MIREGEKHTWKLLKQSWIKPQKNRAERFHDKVFCHLRCVCFVTIQRSPLSPSSYTFILRRNFNMGCFELVQVLYFTFLPNKTELCKVTLLNLSNFKMCWLENSRWTPYILRLLRLRNACEETHNSLCGIILDKQDNLMWEKPIRER